MIEDHVVKDYLYDTYDTYWSVDNRKTYCKPEALIWANGDKSKVKFHWMEKTWDHIDFGQEPKISWNQLCYMRARQIREKYDWVCLWFSGGYDSMHVLHSFIESGTLIDEIAMFDWSSYYDDGECRTAQIIAEQYRLQHNPNLKITIVETDWNCYQKWYRERPDWLTTCPGDTIRFTRPNFYARMHMNSKMRSILENSLGRAEVTGFEKPRVSIWNNTWQTFMPDTLMSNSVASGVVQFYCSHEMPELHVKQVYLAIDFFEKHGLSDNDSVHGIQSHKPVKGMDWYMPYSLGIGRRLPVNPASQTTRDKLAGSPSLRSFKDSKIISHAELVQDESYKIFMNGINTLKEFLPEWDPYSSNYLQYSLSSKFITVRPVKSQNQRLTNNLQSPIIGIC